MEEYEGRIIIDLAKKGLETLKANQKATNDSTAKELLLLRKIAKEVKNIWDKNLLKLEDVHLKNLLTDYIDLKDRMN